MGAESRRFEPWPVALALCLAFMISVCLAFWWTATRHADVEVIDRDERPGLALPGGEASDERRR